MNTEEKNSDTKLKNYNPPDWDELFMRHAYLIATKSKDRHTKIGAVLVKNKSVISEGYNGLIRNVNDFIEERWDRPEKYYWCEHAERNALYNCAREGIKTEGSILYCFGLPCADCCRGLIQCGVEKIITHKQWEEIGINKNNPKWIESTARSLTMMREAKVELVSLNVHLYVKTYVDGKEYIV